MNQTLYHTYRNMCVYPKCSKKKIVTFMFFLFRLHLSHIRCKTKAFRQNRQKKRKEKKRERK